jgi:phosphoglycerate dehydrogenase-like enzyme
MGTQPLKIWCNALLGQAVLDSLRDQLKGHQLVMASSPKASNLVSSGPDPQLAECDVAFGQPDPDQVMASTRIQWVHLTSAGYTRYDTDAFRQAMRGRGSVLTNSSWVYAEPCAEHALAMMLALARRLPQAMADQLGGKTWNYLPLRAESRLLVGQRVLILGYGAIARRLVELLAPFKMEIIAVRRRATGDEQVKVAPVDQVDSLIAGADHVVNVLPLSESTRTFMGAERIGRMKRSAIFYNIGRGDTVDQPALLDALRSGRIAGAYLDVTSPEPLPADHPLWAAPNCYITPHTAGGHDNEFHRLAAHFLQNLTRFTNGQPLVDQVI